LFAKVVEEEVSMPVQEAAFSSNVSLPAALGAAYTSGNTEP
jgi:hypothetical protein